MSFAASVLPGKSRNELASSSDTTNRVPHLGHFSRLPAVILCGQVQDDATSIALNGTGHGLLIADPLLCMLRWHRAARPIAALPGSVRSVSTILPLSYACGS